MGKVIVAEVQLGQMDTRQVDSGFALQCAMSIFDDVLVDWLQSENGVVAGC